VTQTETKIFHYDLRGHLIAETNQTGQMLAEYVYLGDQLLAVIKPGESVYYFHNDHLGTPQVLTNDSQAISWKAVYTPFGDAVPSIATIENPFRFPGQYYDSETGLHYNYFRYYNPQTGRYITPDPIGLEGGINLFAYVGGNPVNWVDPLGLHGPGYIPPSGHSCVSTGTCHYMGSNPVDLGFDLSTWREKNYGTISSPPPFYQRFKNNVYTDICNFIDPSLPNQRVDLFMEYLDYAMIFAGSAAGGAVGTAAKGIVGRSHWFTDNVFRWGKGAWETGPSKWHFHLWPAIEHHLPHQFRTWFNHSKAIMKGWFK